MKKSTGPEWCSVPPTHPAPPGQAYGTWLVQLRAHKQKSAVLHFRESAVQWETGVEAPFLWVPGERPTEGGRGCGRRRCPVSGAEGCYSHCLTTTCLRYWLNI